MRACVFGFFYDVENATEVINLGGRGIFFHRVYYKGTMICKRNCIMSAIIPVLQLALSHNNTGSCETSRLTWSRSNDGFLILDMRAVNVEQCVRETLIDANKVGLGGV